MKKAFLFRLFALVAAILCALGTVAAEAYANYLSSKRVLTFYYDNLRSTRTGKTYSLNTNSDYPGWYNDDNYIYVLYVVFDSTFVHARPTSTKRWFFGMNGLQSITGINYLNTENVTDMQGMFLSCISLTSLNLRSFNTTEVTNMYGMFDNCNSLTSLDLSSFNTSKVTDMTFMFSKCNHLKTIYVSQEWTTAAVTSSYEMFKYCNELVGGLGTAYDNTHVDASYAHIDGDPANPGYFTEAPFFLRGDVNGNGVVTIGDVTDLIDYLLKGNATGINVLAADCDQDGKVSIGDVTALIDYLLSGSW